MSRKHRGPDRTDVPPCVSGGASPSGTHVDLCSTCNHGKTCSNRGTPERPVFFCEQFEDSVPVSAPAPAAGLPEKPRSEQDARQYKGLCVNCENRQSCTITKQAGGVWHCEEYR
jgi:hypothetical protein